MEVLEEGSQQESARELTMKLHVTSRVAQGNGSALRASASRRPKG